MKHRPMYAALAVAFCLASTAQTPTPTPTPTPRPVNGGGVRASVPPKPLAMQAPGAAPDKVWYNATSKVYHCPDDRYYGRTKEGKYLTEAEAKAAGAHGPRGKTCFK